MPTIVGLCPVAQPVASPTADPGVGSLIPAWFHTFLEIDCEIISTFILLLPLIQEGLLSVTSEGMCRKGQSYPEKVWLGELTIST